MRAEVYADLAIIGRKRLDWENTFATSASKGMRFVIKNVFVFCLPG